MLDQTVHRTLLEKQQMSEELAANAGELEAIVRQNKALRAKQQAHKRELELQQQAHEEQLRRNMASRKLAETTAEQYERISAELAQVQERCEATERRLEQSEADLTQARAELEQARARIRELSATAEEQQELISSRLQPLEMDLPSLPPYLEWQQMQ